jgi:hypothetical protein
MKSFGDELLKYWAILSALGMVAFFGVVWGIRLEMKTNTNSALAAEHDKTIDKLQKEVDRLNTIEEMREKGLCK